MLPDMQLARQFEDWFKIAVRLQAGRPLSRTRREALTVDSLADEVERLEESADATPGYPEAVLQDARFAVRALLDELQVRHLAAENRGQDTRWKSFSGNELAGHDFYKRLDEISKGGSEQTAELLEVYCLCLLLGYEGGRGQRDRQQEIDRLVRRISLPQSVNLFRGAEHLGVTGTLSPANDHKIRQWHRLCLAVGVGAVIFYAVAFLTLWVVSSI